VEVVAPHGANICFTGGEPFLQNHEAFHELADGLAKRGYIIQEVFTNGTIRFPDWVYDYMYVIMDWKLSGAGEEVNIFGTEGVQSIRLRNVERMSEGDVVKFTIASKSDYEEAKQWYTELAKLNAGIDFIYGVVWGKLEAKDLIGWVLRDSLVEWTYSHQLHNVIWDREKRAI
jgi:organic radical activating enzyme